MDNICGNKINFKDLFKNKNGLIIIDNDNYCILEINSYVSECLGYESTEITGLKFEDIFVSITCLSSKATTLEAQLRKKDGTIVNVDLISSALMFNGKDCVLFLLRDINAYETTNMLALSIDINGNKKAEMLLSRYKLLSEHARDIILFVRRDGRIIEANDSAVKAYGYSRDELLSMGIYDLRAQETKPVVEFQMEQANHDGILFETIHQRKDGSTFHVEVSSQGNMIGNERVLLSIIRDINDRKRMEDNLRSANEELEASYEEIVATEEELKQRFEELQKTEEDLRASEERFRELFNNANDAMFLSEVSEDGTPGRFIEVNDVVCQRLGYSKQEFLTMSHKDIEDKDDDMSKIVQKSLTKDHFTFEITYVSKGGNKTPVEINSHIFYLDDREVILSIARDISERKLAEEKLHAAHQQLLDIIEFLPDATFVVGNDKKIIAWNRAIEEMTGISKEDMIGKGDHAYTIAFYGAPRPCLIDLVLSDNKEIELLYDYVERRGRTLFTEVFVPSLFEGKGAYIWVKTSPLLDNNGNIVGAIEAMRDITERKRTEEQLKYLSLYDSLTKLYNRTYFEEEMGRLDNGRCNPISIIMCDVDGLKLVNDTFGHLSGDNLLKAASRVIKEAFRGGDMVARIGGDEFAVLLPNSDVGAVKGDCNRIRLLLSKYNSTNPEIPLSLSIGCATQNDASTKLSDVFKEADNKMYREKLHRSQSARSAIVQTLMKALEARDYITEGHADRLQNLVVNLAMAIDLPEHRITDLRLLAHFHDIGKVGIPDRILFKPGPLTTEEANEMRRHCEIGYRIAMSSRDLIPIAEWILKHHEWWNGEGYPLGLKGEEIPLECRILAIVDAYDAMTSDRPYRKAMSHNKAVMELRRCAGAQFDPLLVDRLEPLLG